MRHTFYLGAWLYSSTIDFLLKNPRNRVAEYARHYNLFPLLDMCCGTGAQCRILVDSKNQTFGLDLDLKMLVYASSKSPRIPYICADASRVPIKVTSIKGMILSYSLHEKHPKIRQKIISEARKLLIPDGKIIFLDYDAPWNSKSCLAKLYNSLIERGGGTEHYAYFQNFLRRGGLSGFIKQENINEIERHDIEWACSRIILADFS